MVCAVLYGGGTSCVVLQDKQGPRVFGSGGQGEIFGCKEIEVTGDRRKLIRSFMAFTPEPILLG